MLGEYFPSTYSLSSIIENIFTKKEKIVFKVHFPRQRNRANHSLWLRKRNCGSFKAALACNTHIIIAITLVILKPTTVTFDIIFTNANNFTRQRG